MKITMIMIIKREVYLKIAQVINTILLKSKSKLLMKTRFKKKNKKWNRVSMLLITIKMIKHTRRNKIMA